MAREFRDHRVTLPMLEAQALRLADADSDNDRAYERERKRLWRMWRRSIEIRAARMARKVHAPNGDR
jgi:hypothetical protein